MHIFEGRKDSFLKLFFEKITPKLATQIQLILFHFNALSPVSDPRSESRGLD